MKPAPLLSLWVLAVAAGCYSYSEPPLPTNTRSVTPHSRQLAASGLDVPLTTPGAYQRSGMSGTTSDVDDEAETLFAMQEMAWADPGLGSSRPQADLDAPNELRNATPRGAVSARRTTTSSTAWTRGPAPMPCRAPEVRAN